MASNDAPEKILSKIASFEGDLSALHQEIGAEPRPVQTDTFDIADSARLEQRIAEIWCEVLDVSSVDFDADLFELGGDSIQAVQILYQIRAHLERDLSFMDLLQGSLTVRSMASKLREEASTADQTSGV